MASELAIPSITSEDLVSFHSAHLGHDRIGHEDEVGGEGHIDLGCYPDGQLRTLTDDEVAIFRHSEIQALLLQRTRAREAAAELKRASPSADELSDGEIKSSRSSDDSGDGHDEPLAAGSPTVSTTPGRKDAPKLDDFSDANDELEYAQFLESERREFEKSTQRQRHNRPRGYDDRIISTRRRIRELDACADSAQVLSYDDDPEPYQKVANTHGTKAASTMKEEGRQIWWPEIAMNSTPEF